MSGTFERLKYDPNTYAAELKQSTGAVKYRLDPYFANQCAPCRAPEVGFIGKQGVSITHQRPLIDVDSDLRLLNFQATRDPSQKYQPQCPDGKNRDGNGYPCGGGVTAGFCDSQEKLHHFPICEIGTDYTRISNPTCTMRGTGVNRFQPLCLQPQDQCRWLNPSEVGINYRMVVKDNHTPCIPKLVDPTPLLPKGGDLPCPPVRQICGNYRKPLHNTYKDLNRNWNGLN